MAIEDIFDDIGGMSTFQVIIMVWLYGLKCLVGWSMMQMSFAAYGPDYRCVTDDLDVDVSANGSLTSFLSNTTVVNVCSVNGSSCSDYVFSGVKRTIVTEFDLVCDEKWIRSLMTSVQMAGVMFGAAIAGQAGDMFGRKPTNYGFYLLGAIFNVIAFFSVTWQMFLVLRFLIGISIGAMLVIVIPYPAEFFPQRWRYLVTVMPTWPIGVLAFTLCAYLTEDWAYLHLFCAVFMIPGLLGYFYVPESVRWLTVQGRVEEAMAVIKKIAKVNKKPVPSYARDMLQSIAEQERETQGKQRKYSYLDIFKTRQVLRLTLVFAYHWGSLSIVFYGLGFAVAGLDGDLYMNMFLLTMAELPAYLFNLCLAQRLGRRWTCFAFYAVAAVASAGCVVVTISDSSAVGKALITAFCMTAKLCCAAGWAVNQTWVAESYPTVTRSLGYASANIAARLGGIIAPFIITPGETPLLTFSIMFVLMLVGTLITPLVPETKDIVLQESVEVDPETADGMAHRKNLQTEDSSSSSSETADQELGSPKKGAENINGDLGLGIKGEEDNAVRMKLIGWSEEKGKKEDSDCGLV